MAAATTIAAVGVGVSAAGAGASFIQAAKQQGLQRKAEAAAEKAMAEARKKLDVNFYDQLSINKEPYELQREALLSQGAQAITAAQEGERNVAATAGRVAMAQNEAQGQIRTAMGKEMQDLERLSATEESRLRDINVQIDMEQAKGAQLAARDAQQQAAQATQQGIAGIQNTAQQVLTSFVPLYANNKGALQQEALSKMTFTPDQFKSFGNVPGNILGAPGSEGFSNLDFTAIANLSPNQFDRFKRSLSDTQYNMLFQNPTYLSNYQQINPYAITGKR